MRNRIAVRAGATALAVGALALAVPLSANAHVTIRPDNDQAGAWSKITVRVPNESDTAGTVGLTLQMPADVVLGSVRVQPHVGWTADVTREPLAEPVTVGHSTLDERVVSVTWTAEPGTRIGPDEFDEFAISVGPLPDPGTYAFPTTQTYDDGEVVAWDEPVVEGEEEPERPAPSLTVVPASDEGHGHGSADEEHEPVTGDENRGRSSSDDGLARGLATGGIVVGAAGLGFGAAALRRSRA